MVGLSWVLVAFCYLIFRRTVYYEHAWKSSCTDGVTAAAATVVLFAWVLPQFKRALLLAAGMESSQTGSDDGLLFGVNRAVRSDEWAVNTPMAFAQYYDPQGAYPYFGQVMRGAITDSFIVYGQPVWG
ncbi:MAG: hypothetical protein ACLVHV_15640 [Oscillospiraceae bacterium]